jgi:hypothetical protein
MKSPRAQKGNLQPNQHPEQNKWQGISPSRIRDHRFWEEGFFTGLGWELGRLGSSSDP